MKRDYIYKICTIKMSNKSMSDLLYATIMTQSSITSSFGVGIYKYDRKINSRHYVDLMIHIHPDKISEFENISNIRLTENIIAKTN